MVELIGSSWNTTIQSMQDLVAVLKGTLKGAERLIYGSVAAMP